MNLRLACLAVVAGMFAATAQAATPPGQVFKFPLPAANHAKLYVISATLKPGVPAQAASMGIIPTNANSLPGGIRAAAATGKVTKGATTTYYVAVAVNNLGGRILHSRHFRNDDTDIEVDLIYSGAVFNIPRRWDGDCKAWKHVALYYTKQYYKLDGSKSPAKDIVDRVLTKLGC